MDYSKTVQLPKTEFPMRGNLAKREPDIAKLWNDLALYEKLLAQRQDAPPFILHDGPPYANGNIHIGHALNKILKDIIVKERFLRGYKAPYIPGWDCHGLPIEHKVVTELGDERSALSQVELRKRCRDYALNFMRIQRDEFRRLGILGDWENPYLTLKPSYEYVVLDTLSRLVKGDYVYRGLKPIHWCISCTTALAEAEVEYEDHASPSIYVAFPIEDAGGSGLSPETELVIWTTTPWTLPANLAVAFHPGKEYATVDYQGRQLLLAAELADSVGQKLGQHLPVVRTIPGRALAGVTFRHPFVDRTGTLLPADFVDMETGSGLVHIAPGHGHDDYLLGKANGLEPYCPVDSNGTFTADFPEMQGVQVWDANPKIIALLEERERLLHSEKMSHSYPCCWRCKKPVIFRATAQWFVNVEAHGLRQQALEAIRTTMWIPPWGENRIAGMVEQRPDWCLSRQRAWGVPIPALICKKCGEVALTGGVIDFLAERVRREGVDIWFSDPVEQLVPDGTVCGTCGAGDFDKGSDIIDVWFESGCSSRAVLVEDHNLPWPADLYLEGSDQHRGWFQSSLLAMLGAFGSAPYKAVLTHGFTVTQEGKKMSKSLGNDVPPQDITKRYGADILRLWVAAEDYREDIRISETIIKGLGQNYRLIRNTLRFCLGNLRGFDPENHRVAYEDMLEVDRWALARLHQLVGRCGQAYGSYAFHQVITQLTQFCSVAMSSFYLNLLKDRIYCDGVDWPSRRSAQTALYDILRAITIIIAPILSHTAEEVWQAPLEESGAAFADHIPSVFLADWPSCPAAWQNPDLLQRWDAVLASYPTVMKALEGTRSEKCIGASLEAAVTIGCKDPALREALARIPDLETIYVVSQLILTDFGEGVWRETDDAIAVRVERAAGVKCVRCWRYVTDGTDDSDGQHLCPRCRKAV